MSLAIHTRKSRRLIVLQFLVFLSFCLIYFEYVVPRVKNWAHVVRILESMPDRLANESQNAVVSEGYTDMTGLEGPASVEFIEDESEAKVVARPEDLFPPPQSSDEIEPVKEQSDPVVKNPAPSSPSHEYRPDGLLVVNPEAPHPIFELIRRAEDVWATKLRRASKTLSEAVEEYQRRYGRPPPRGFDHWWKYVEEHDVQLPDEYDQIHEDLAPFWGINPEDLQALASAWEEHKDGFVLGKTKKRDPISVLKTAFLHQEQTDFHLIGAREMMTLLKDVQQHLPPFRAIFSPHDNPNLMTNFRLKKKALDAAANGTYIDVEEDTPVESFGWLSACAPDSLARRQPSKLFGRSRPTSRKTFIHDHHLSMDPCLHPSHLHLHGQFISHSLGPNPHPYLFPQFSWSTTDLHHDLRPTTPSNWVEDVYPRADDPEWEDKEDERLLWRGSNTGIWHGSDRKWWNSHRERLIERTTRLDGNERVLLPTRFANVSVGEGVEMKASRLNPAAMDVQFAGEPLACESAICEILSELFDWAPRQSQRTAGRYKYVLDVDGNGWSSRYKRLITSNSLVFKSTIYREWFQNRIQPWVHYVPVQVDFSDLYDTLFFFRGDLNGEGGHDDLAKKIAVAGRDWSKRFWRREDMTAYMFRMLLEYARVMSSDREAMSYRPLKPVGRKPN